MPPRQFAPILGIKARALVCCPRCHHVFKASFSSSSDNDAAAARAFADAIARTDVERTETAADVPETETADVPGTEAADVTEAESITTPEGIPEADTGFTHSWNAGFTEADMGTMTGVANDVSAEQPANKYLRTIDGRRWL